MDAFLNVDTLVVDNKACNIQNIHTLPAELNPSKIATRAIGDNMMAFFGGQSPLSNFHLLKFNIEGIKYKWNEQFNQKKEAEYVNDDDTGARIMKATTPLDCYKIGWELNSKLDLNA